MSAPGTYRTGRAALAVLTVEVLAWGAGLAFWATAARYLPQFRVLRPEMLWGLLAGPGLVLLYLLGLHLRNRALRRFSQPAMIAAMVPGVSTWRSALKFLLVRHGLSFAVFALAGPQMGTRLEQVTARGVDVVVALDVSNSMLAEDLKPDRMEVAKRALEQLVDRLSGDRLGVVVFAGEAYTQLPITADRSAAKLFLGSLGPNLVRAQGTAIGAAIDQARKSFGPDAAKGKAILVISDGEGFEDDAEAAARRAAAEGIIVHTIGMGSPQGAPIPVRVGGRVVGFKKDKEGQTVVTKLDPAMLQRIAQAGGGEYVQASTHDAGVNNLISKLREMDQTNLGTYAFAGHEDRYQYFLVVACALIAWGLLISERTATPSRSRSTPWHA
ncbi:MAG: VWA domain-containing protein [Flavobacteriales bacterium]|nr:VWA domain-containing protein [Flavobacteriales bacterium]MBP9080382.1 VWA domain-containing protein [Flavobacteriales bacterium]